jgi:predicted DNA-binding transcriptional regulator AlpA
MKHHTTRLDTRKYEVTMNPDLQLITPDEAAQMFGVSKRAFLELDIPRVALGHRTLRYRAADIEQFLDSASASDDSRMRHAAEDEGT